MPRSRLVVGLLAALCAAGCGGDTAEPATSATSAVESPRTTPAPDGGGSALLREVAAAERSVAYVGTKRTIHGPRGTSRETVMEVERAAGGATVVRWNDRVWSYRDLPVWLAEPELLLENYRVVVDDEHGEPVAWRPTRLIRLVPRRSDRPSAEILVDREHGVVLQEQRYHADGTERLTKSFDAVEFRAPPAAPEDLEVLEPRVASLDTPPPTFWRVVGSLPDGFRRVRRERLECGAAVDYYSDGLAAFAVMQAPVPPAAEDSEPCVTRRRGHESVVAVQDGLRVVVEGELPVELLRQVLDGILSRP